MSRGGQVLLGIEDIKPFLNTSWIEFWQGADRQAAMDAIAHFRHTLETGEPYHAPSTVERRLDLDEVESYDWKLERIVLPDGRFGVVCHFYDLSERQQFEAAFAASSILMSPKAKTLTDRCESMLKRVISAPNLLR